MANSRKKTPIFSLGSDKRKPHRTQANRLFRRKERQLIQEEKFGSLPEKVSEISDVWGWPCDAKAYCDPSEFNEDYRWFSK